MNKRKMQAVVIVDPRSAIVNGSPSADAMYSDNINNNKGDKKGQNVNSKNMSSAQNNNNNDGGNVK